MLTIETLKEFGADVNEGLNRCMNNESFYLMLIGKALADNRLEQLEEQLSNKDLDGAFESAHALKGMYANLSLTPLSKPIIEMTELLRSRTEMDYSSLLDEVKTQFTKLKNL
jgi:HPt (histidine-containing phosphotransfer) domain-containing protein